jgi:hypothetical protein
MYGHRARIGYTSVAFVTEVFPYAFYKMVPDGVSLALLTLHQTELTRGEMNRLYNKTMMAARACGVGRESCRSRRPPGASVTR